MVYIATRGVWNEILEIRTDGSAPRTIVEKGGPIFHGLSVSTDGAIAATIANSPSHPKEAYTVRLQSGQVRRTTTHNPWLKAKSFGNQQVVNYKARDGMDIEGLLIHPVAGTNKGTAPLIVMVHGGPEAHYSNGWITNYSTPGQVAAGRGFAVLYPNYRGSTGRGVAFAKGDHGDPAGREFDDLLDGVAHLDKKGLIDKKRVGITGGSYGGYASAWGATAHTEHYAASVVFVGVSNQISKVGTTDIPNEMKLVHFLQYAWDNWDFFLKRSPVYHADKCKTPTLILHGKADTRVDPGQSRELYRHIKMRGNAPVRLVLYPGEGHGNRKAANRYDYNLRMMRWMEHYLKGDGKEMPALSPEYAPSTKAATSKRKKRGKNRKKR
jgi:dipeptidyl aminopeptidase/acylaminoacyl peptidase